MPQVTASAPGKLMLTGGYAVVHGEPCLVTAVDQRLSVTVKKNGIDVMHIFAPDLGLEAYSKTIQDLGNKELPKAVRFIEMLYKRFLSRYPQQEGINVVTKSSFSAAFGFGSSSAVTVAFAKALTSLYEIPLTDTELFELCYQSVLDVQGVGSGYDIAAAIWGGLLVYEAPAKRVERVRVELPSIVVGYTGVKADTPTLIHMVNSQLQKKPAETKQIFTEVGQVTEQLAAQLKENNWEEAGRLLTHHQQLMNQLKVSSTELDTLINASLQAGAMGATLSGAGGGDCMIAMVAPENKQAVEAAIKQAGGEVIPVGLQAEGVRLE